MLQQLLPHPRFNPSQPFKNGQDIQTSEEPESHRTSPASDSLTGSKQKLKNASMQRRRFPFNQLRCRAYPQEPACNFQHPCRACRLRITAMRPRCANTVMRVRETASNRNERKTAEQSVSKHTPAIKMRSRRSSVCRIISAIRQSSTNMLVHLSTAGPARSRRGKSLNIMLNALHATRSEYHHEATLAGCVSSWFRKIPQ